MSDVECVRKKSNRLPTHINYTASALNFPPRSSIPYIHPSSAHTVTSFLSLLSFSILPRQAHLLPSSSLSTLLPSRQLRLQQRQYCSRRFIMASNGSNGEYTTGTGSEKIQTDIITLTRFLTEEQIKHKEATGDFTLLCQTLQFSFKMIAYYIRRATLINLTGLAGSSNTTGDDQKKLDVISNDLFLAAMRGSGKCRAVVSEEEEDIIYFDEHPNARYVVACDPIDGSSNLDAGVSVGTIFGIMKLPDNVRGRRPTAEDLCMPGTELLASGFTMYGASAQLVITMKGGTVNGFTLDNALGEFILTHPSMQMPKKRSIYSVNEGNSHYWEDKTINYFNSLKSPAPGTDASKFKPYSARYIGSMVADAYRTLLYGGIFAYPADKKSPKGKLRILYECAPMAMVMENAGGHAVNSKMERMLEVKPEHIHDRSGIYMGSIEEVEKVIAAHK